MVMPTAGSRTLGPDQRTSCHDGSGGQRRRPASAAPPTTAASTATGPAGRTVDRERLHDADDEHDRGDDHVATAGERPLVDLASAEWRAGLRRVWAPALAVLALVVHRR